MNHCYQLTLNNVKNPVCENLADIFPQLYDIIFKSPELYNGIDLKTTLRGATVKSIYLTVPVTKFSLEYDNGIVMYNECCVIKISSLFPQLSVFDKLLMDISTNTFTSKCNASTINKPLASNENTFANKQRMPNQTNSDKKKIIPNATKMLPQKPVPKIQKPIAQMTTEDEQFELEKEKKRNAVIEQNRIDESYRVFENDKRSFTQINKDINNGLLLQDDIHPCFVAKYVVFSILRERGVINFENNDQSRKEYDIFMDLYQSLEYEDPTCEQSSQTIHIPHNYLFMTDAQKEECAKKNNMTTKQLENHISKISSGSIDDIFV